MASVAICRDKPYKHDVHHMSKGQCFNKRWLSLKRHEKWLPFQPSPAPSCPRQHARWAASSPRLRPLQWRAPQPGWAASAPSRTQRLWPHWCPCWRSSASAWPNVLLWPRAHNKITDFSWWFVEVVFAKWLCLLSVCVCVCDLPLVLGQRLWPVSWSALQHCFWVRQTSRGPTRQQR